MSAPDGQSRVLDTVAMEGVVAAVRRFHKATDTPVRIVPRIPSTARRDLRINLINSETNKELIPALVAGDMVEIADGIADAIYVAVGTALEYGIPLSVIWSLVCATNDAKIDPTTGMVVRRADGKILKPPGWSPPDIERALLEHGWDPTATPTT